MQPTFSQDFLRKIRGEGRKGNLLIQYHFRSRRFLLGLENAGKLTMLSDFLVWTTTSATRLGVAEWTAYPSVSFVAGAACAFRISFLPYRFIPQNTPRKSERSLSARDNCDYFSGCLVAYVDLLGMHGKDHKTDPIHQLLSNA